MTTQLVLMPDVESSGEVVEFCVQPGDSVTVGDSVLVLESDKASMEVPASISGIVEAWLVEIGESVETDKPLLKVRATGTAELVQSSTAEPHSTGSASEPDSGSESDVTTTVSETLRMPDAGGAGDVVEICVAVGDGVEKGDTLLVVESDKASMEVPAERSGVIEQVLVEEGSSIDTGSPLFVVSAIGSKSSVSVTGSQDSPSGITQVTAALNSNTKTDVQAAPTSGKLAAAKATSPMSQYQSSQSKVFNAGPAVRRLARELGVDLSNVIATGRRQRILKEDVALYTQQMIKQAEQAPAQGPQADQTVVTGGIPAMPMDDFSRYGEIEEQGMTGIAKATVAHMTRCWLNIPHVTLFDEVDITDLESFRSTLNPDAFGLQKKPTLLPFLVAIVAKALKEHPQFNAALDAENSTIIRKSYINIGIAVDSPAGLVVPVIRNADQKSIIEIAREIIELSTKARERKLKPADMQGGCFTLSSLGPTGGSGFTPIVNGPEVAILGVAKSSVKPSWNGKEFLPRTQLPLCLSFDHRAINGGDAGRFMAYVHGALVDMRRTLL